MEELEDKVRDIIKGFKPKNVFNADKTGLFYRLLPNKTLTFEVDSCHGG